LGVTVPTSQAYTIWLPNEVFWKEAKPSNDLAKTGTKAGAESSVNVMILDTLILWNQGSELRWLHSWKHIAGPCGEQQDPLDGVSRHFPSGHGANWRLSKYQSRSPSRIDCARRPSGCGNPHCFISSLDSIAPRREIWIDGGKWKNPVPTLSFSFRSLGSFLAYGKGERRIWSAAERDRQERTSGAGRYYLNLVRLSHSRTHPHQLSGA